MHVRLGGLFSIAFVAVVLAACGGGAGNLVIVPTSAPPTAAAQLMPTTQSTTAAVTTAGGTISLPGVSNGTSNVISSATVTVPALTAAGTAAATLTAERPAGITAPSIKRPNTLGTANVPLAFVTVSFQQNETLNASPGFSITVPSGVTIPAGNAYLVVSSPVLPGGWNYVSGPVAVAGSTLTFVSAAITPPLTLQAGIPYIFAIVTTGSATIAQPTPVPPTPTPQPTINPAGSAAYAGTKTQTFAYGFYFSYPAASPGATAPPSTTTYAVTANVSIGTSPNPGSGSNTLDEHTVENDASGVSTTTLDTDSWLANGAATNSSDAVLLYAQLQTEPSSANEPVITTTYNTPLILDEFPQAGATWTNLPTSTVSYAYASGDSGTRTVNSNGTYRDIEQIGPISNGTNATLVENVDGSGSITGPYYGGGQVNSITISAPSPVPAASPNVNITFNYSLFLQQNYGYPATSTSSEPVWYTTPPAFYSETDTVTTGATLPASCTPNSYGTTANDVHRVVTTLDTVVGFLDTTTFDAYVASGTAICLTTNDVLSYAYDFQGNTPYTLYYGPLGVETTTTTESLILQAGAVGPLLSHRSTTNAASSGVNAGTLALEAHELAGFARARQAHQKAFLAPILKGGRS